jgi:hypothetical protein
MYLQSALNDFYRVADPYNYDGGDPFSTPIALFFTPGGQFWVAGYALYGFVSTIHDCCVLPCAAPTACMMPHVLCNPLQDKHVAAPGANCFTCQSAAVVNSQQLSCHNAVVCAVSFTALRTRTATSCSPFR